MTTLAIIHRKTLLLAAIVLGTGCAQKQPSATGNSSDTADTANNTVTALPDLKNKTPAIPDTQFIVVDSTVNIRLNNDLVPRRSGAFDSTLAAYWLQCYTDAQKLPKYLRFKYQGTVMMGARGSLMDAVVHVQDSLKAHIAQDRYKQGFSTLTPQQQKELKETYPVLFQKGL